MHGLCNFKYFAPQKIIMVFHNRSNYEYHFFIKGLTEEFNKQFTCFGENTKKYITLAVSIEKKLQELIKMEKKLQKKHILHIQVY